MGHDDFVSSAAFSPDGKRIVTASSDTTARLWDADTGREIGALYAYRSARVNSAAFSPDGKFIVTASDDATAQRGGRAKRYFKLLPAGVRALSGSKAVFDRMWEGLHV